ncbi:3-dehydrosphinganine reductase [Mycoemilia scoparia]|uniref:3-dehydrosphinganine reductase n=1 Tax=Mycoemilia scoparia TaxID=417184 RepID=A0A9W7ZSL1_9FUNG|nr:3-dehydrosphinganine reductase [Mycoemilia scoparia]
MLLVKRGANVTIVARNETKLKEAAEEIRAFQVSRDQKVIYISADCASPSGTKEAIKKASDEHNGQIPYHVFLCAGQSLPGMFIEQDPSVFERNMNINYLGSVYTAHESARLMAENGVHGSITFVSSVLGFFGLVGYSQYVPTKYAIRGLADSLRNELKAYGINVHCYFPATILTPGYDEENKTKPNITKEIEGTDEGQTPEVCAQKMLDGLDRGEYFIASDPLGWIFRSSCSGLAPGNNIISDTILSLVGWVALPIWRTYADYLVKASSKQNNKTKTH